MKVIVQGPYTVTVCFLLLTFATFAFRMHVFYIFKCIMQNICSSFE